MAKTATVEKIIVFSFIVIGTFGHDCEGETCSNAKLAASGVDLQRKLPDPVSVEQRETNRATVEFVGHMLLMKGKSYTDTFCSRSKDDCSTVDGYPGSFSHSELTLKKISEELVKVSGRELNGEIRRLGDLGYFIFNDLLWTNDWKTFPIGADLEDHRKHRPTADLLMGKNSAAWNRDMIKRSVRDFFKGRSNITSADFNMWVTKLFHKILLNMDISDAEAEDFDAFKVGGVKVNVLPRWISGRLLDVETLRQKRDELLEKYSTALAADTRGIIPELAGRDRRFLADLILTTMTSAGGLSVPSVIQLCLGIVYGNKASPLPSESRKMTNKNVMPLVLETIRRYPVVVGFPWWSPDQSKRTVMNLAMGLRDPRAWKDADAFKLRPLSEYHEKVGPGTKIGLAYAEQAMGPHGLTPDSRGCPGQELSLVIITEFLKGLLPTQSEWLVSDMPKGGIRITEGPSQASEITLTRDTDYVDVSDAFAAKDILKVRGFDGKPRRVKCCCPANSQRCKLAWPSASKGGMFARLFDADGCGHLVGSGWHTFTRYSGKCWVPKKDAEKKIK